MVIKPNLPFGPFAEKANSYHRWASIAVIAVLFVLFACFMCMKYRLAKKRLDAETEIGKYEFLLAHDRTEGERTAIGRRIQENRACLTGAQGKRLSKKRLLHSRGSILIQKEAMTHALVP